MKIRASLLVVLMLLLVAIVGVAGCAHKQVYWSKPGEYVSSQQFERDKLGCMQYANANTPRLQPIYIGNVPVDQTPSLMVEVFKTCMRAKGYVESSKP